MRPVRRGPKRAQLQVRHWTDALDDLYERIGGYCSYCERPLGHAAEVEHVQPKGLPQYAHLKLEWTNFLVSCKNCNTRKSNADVVLAAVALPDRDNTFRALVYMPNGHVRVSDALSASQRSAIDRTMALVRLNEEAAGSRELDAAVVARTRLQQRREAFARAETSAQMLRETEFHEATRNIVVKLALATGFFSVWMTVFQTDADMKIRFIHAFPGTHESGCFDATGGVVVPAPNPDELASGGKL